jgi:hypothetical protein
MKIAPAAKFALTAFCILNLAFWTKIMASDPPRQRQDFNQFWSIFRNATLHRDWQKLEGLTNFPLTLKGELDRDPIRRVGRREFPRIFDRFLKEGVFSPNEQVEFIRKTTTIQTAADSEDKRRVGDMVFKKTGKAWRLDTLYMQYTSG